MRNENTILVIDDEVTILRSLEFSLSKEGYAVVTAQGGAEGLKKVREQQPDLILLDVLMPDMDGWEVCQKIREIADIPVIMLTAMSQERQVAKGLNNGADDYVIKPFSLIELIARVKAVLRRARRPSPSVEPPLVFEDGRLVIDSSTREVIKEGRTSPLSALEFKTLYYLARNAGRVLSNRQILKEVWGPEYVDDTHYVKVYIRHIREKIEADPNRPVHILTRRGLGYFFQSAESAS